MGMDANIGEPGEDFTDHALSSREGESDVEAARREIIDYGASVQRVAPGASPSVQPVAPNAHPNTSPSVQRVAPNEHQFAPPSYGAPFNTSGNVRNRHPSGDPSFLSNDPHSYDPEED